MAKEVWQECRTARPRGALRVAQTHRCTHGGHPDRGVPAKRQIEPVLSWLRRCREKTVVAALASLSLWSRSRTAGPLFGLSGLHALSRPIDPVMCPECDPLGKCGGALAGRACTGAPTGE